MLGCTKDGLVDYLKFVDLIDYRRPISNPIEADKTNFDILNTARNNYSTNYHVYDANINKISTKVIN